VVTSVSLKIKLISLPGLDPLIPRILYLPIGIATVSALLKQGSYDVEKEDFNVTLMRVYSRFFHLRHLFTILRMRSPEQLSGHIFQQNLHPGFDEYIAEAVTADAYRDFDVIGLSALSHEAFLFALLFARWVKRVYPEKTVVLGGAYLSIMKERFFDRIPYVDFAIHGRGDVPMLWLMNHLSQGSGALEKIEGLIYRDAKGYTRVNDPCEGELDEEPIPDYDGFDFDSYKGYLQPELGREGYGFSIPYRTNIGCVRRCNFCDYLCVQGSYREKNLDKVVGEIELLSDRYKSPYFHIVDSAINNNPGKLREFCVKLIEKGIPLRWHGYMRATGISRELLTLMKKAGAFSLRWGIESGNTDILRYIGKGYTREQALEALDAACEIGFKNTILMIIGEPYERIDHVKDSLSLLKRYIPKEQVNYLVYRLRLISHSPLFLEPERYGIQNLKPLEGGPELITFNRMEFSFDETKGLGWKKRLALTHRLMRYFLIRIERDEKKAGKKRACIPVLRVWQRMLLEKSYILRYLVALLVKRPMRYIT
jgi:radical SAM superfamily enzyme YgiQ (UPF0313 family)